ncbi:hypothetical protein [Roseateles chitosanitabidus]|uniref:hypothetical protein n=1 Tax=Roseateles chitosanitabidus TaxID=65048 RepID=UPI00082D2771|nr:hypothetical protein [Roseateles chitosanitabidus]
MNAQHPAFAAAGDDDAEWVGDGLPAPDLAERMAAYVASYPDMQHPLPDDAKSAAEWINEGRELYGCR